ncbi:MAG TPA: dihydrolipoyl dehydrogenase [Spirochaetaceae bacterium]|jgi:dihydrolipoamide dehydrogenase|nr:dihydrolipoyl dehydrogenase [Spirochaetaceae bacterium]
MDYDFDLAVIGAGPGGYVAAIRAAQLGLKACVIEKDKPGGVCLNLGCIPSKALIHQADALHGVSTLQALGAAVDLSGVDYGKAFKKSRLAADRLSKGVQFLLKKNGIEYKKGTAKLKAASEIILDDGTALRARAVILATGSRPRELPGLAFDEERILSSSGALMLEKLPKRIAILGAGAIGMELGYVWNAFGAEVTVVEALERILPLEDAEAAALARKIFESRGMRFHTGAFATGVEKSDEDLRLLLKPASPSGEDKATSPGLPPFVEADAVLVAVGRVPNSAGLGLEALGIRTDKGFVEVGDYYETSASGVYAIGDLVATPLLAHVASKEGEIAAERIAQLIKGTPAPTERRVDLSTVPSAVYCDPELASFGLQEEKAMAAGRAYSSFSFPYRGIGKAVATEKPEGFVKLLADPESGEILGATVIGERATDIIHELILARQAELGVEELADMMHAHPTIAEGVMEAARGVLGRAIHV